MALVCHLLYRNGQTTIVTLISSSCPYRASRGARTSRGGAPQACQVTGRDGGRCPNQAEVKLADSLGDSVWACLPHAEDILVTVPAAFIASHDDRGIAGARCGA